MSGLIPNRNIVDIGRYLRDVHGLNIGEHPEFGGVGKGHSPTGYHPVGMAIDVRDWRPDMAPAYKGGQAKHWKQRTGELSWRAKKLGLFSEALGPGDKGHDTHVHLALEGQKPITNQQLEWLATGRYKTKEGKLTDVMPEAVPEAPQLPEAPQFSSDTQTSNEDSVNKLLDALGVGQQPTLKDMLVSQALNQALQRKQEMSGLFNLPQAGYISPEQAMQMFA